MKIIKRASDIPVRIGGIEHSGWLPPNAAMPLTTRVEQVAYDLTIVDDGYGFLLCWSSRDGKHHGDLWFERIEDAKRQAEPDFGVEVGFWQNMATK